MAVTTPPDAKQPYSLTATDGLAPALRHLSDQLGTLAGWWDTTGAHLWFGHCIHYTF